ncbi:MAG: twin-arginine translocase subunit TatB [Gammaproteobacteria bacterium]|nr:MAG: twin-arginine translocase subunit TatB [Gammaproteobacteria bacterium]
MFDIGFWELCLIAVVALLILGPERLPVAARTAGLWVGRARKMIGNVKSEIDRELQLDDVRKRLKEEEVKLRESTGIGDLEGMADNTIADVKDYQESIDTGSADSNSADTADSADTDSSDTKPTETPKKS